MKAIEYSDFINHIATVSPIRPMEQSNEYYNSLPDCYTVQEIDGVLENLRQINEIAQRWTSYGESIKQYNKAIEDIKQALTNLRKDTNNESH